MGSIPSRFRLLLGAPGIRGTFAIAVATVGGQAILIAILPVLSRLYSPAEIGAFSVVVALAGSIAPASALRLDAAVLIPEELRETRALATLAVVAVVLTSSLWALATGLLAPSLLEGATAPHLGVWVFVITLFMGFFMLLSQLAVRDRLYTDIATRSLVQPAVTAAAQVACGIAALGASGLLAGAALGRVAGMVGLALKTRRYFGDHRLADVVSVAKRFWRFPAIFAPSAVFNSLGLQIPLITVAAVYGVETAGYLGIAERVIAIPITVVGTAVGQVFVGEIAKRRRDRRGGYLRMYLKVSGVLALVSLLGVGAIAVSAPWVVPWALGDQWKPAAHFVVILAITGGFRLVVSPMTGVIALFERARASVLLDAMRLTMTCAAVAIIVSNRPTAESAVAILFGALALVYVVTWLYIWRLLRSVEEATTLSR